jgi:simple sugar transport system permease protein
MTGESPHFAQVVGISVFRSRILSMVMSGALCGVAGAMLVSSSQGRFWTEIGSGIGWDAVLVALIGRARIIPTIGWVTIYCLMRGMARGIEQVSTVPAELSLILICGIIIAASARLGLVRSFGSLRRRFAFARKGHQHGVA